MSPGVSISETTTSVVETRNIKDIMKSSDLALGNKLLAHFPEGNFMRYVLPFYMQMLDECITVDIVTERRVTYRQLLEDSIRFAAWIVQNCPRSERNEFLQIFADNSNEWLLAMYAGQFAGLATATASPLWTPARFTSYVQRVQPSIFVADSKSLNDTYKTTLSAIDQLSSLRYIVVIDDDELQFNQPKKTIIRLSQILERNCASFPAALEVLLRSSDAVFNARKFGSDFEHQIAYLVPTSGTTGPPRAITLTHPKHMGRISADLVDNGDPFKMKIVLADNPHTPVCTQMANLLSIWNHFGGMTRTPRQPTSIIMPAVHFNRDLFGLALERYKMKYLSVTVPFVCLFLDKAFTSQYDMSNVSSVFTMSSPLKRPVVQKLCELNNWHFIAQFYGSGEMGLFTSSVNNFNMEKIREKHGSVGTVMPNAWLWKLKRVLQDGTYGGSETDIHEPNEPGELWVKPKPGGVDTKATLFSEYYNDPDKTREVFDADGWYKTGDVMYYDEDEWFWHVERVNELFWIESVGLDGKKQPWTSPSELETTFILQTDDVADAALIQMPPTTHMTTNGHTEKEQNESSLFLIVEPRDRSILGAMQKEVELARKLSAAHNEFVGDNKLLYLRSSSVKFTAQLPRNNSKIMRSLLRDMLKSDCEQVSTSKFSRTV